MEIINNLKNKIQAQGIKLVFPEGEDLRILTAVTQLVAEQLVKPVVLGNVNKIKRLAQENHLNLDQVEIIDPEEYDKSEMVAAFVERRKGKNTIEDAHRLLQDVNYFGTMLVYLQQVDGLVSGAAHSTADTVRPALQIIKTKPGVKRISAAFLMLKDTEKYIFADCAINVDPDAQTLAEIAKVSLETAELFEIDPKVAMLSFSTHGSAKAEQVTKVAEATKIIQAEKPNVAIDGELQFDAAFDMNVAQTKAKGSLVAGQANVFIFPELQSANIGYKIAQRMGHYQAIGPILQGMNKPISDLSRGASSEDIYQTAIITAAQAKLIQDKSEE